MNCPVCNKNLKTVNFENQEIDICQRCGGIWFDKGELEEVINTGAPIKVPVGPGTLGRVLNVVGEPIDDRGPIKAADYWPIHRPAPLFVEQFVTLRLLYHKSL